MIYFEEKEKVRILLNNSNQKNRPHIKYNNVIGEIIEQQGKAYKIKVCFKKKIFKPIVTIDHLRKI